ncbi:MAG: hypothetical protein HRT64_13390 [Erythrobacter sp.]|nr:hypothetical protein [Erythrobacter sp.]
MKATSHSLILSALAAAITTAACANAAPGDDTTGTARTEATQNDTYLDAPQTPGTWEYEDEPGEKLALFGVNPRQPIFLIRCGDGVIALGRVTEEAQTETRAMRVTTETVTSQLEAGPVPPMPRILAADLQPNDPLLDAMAITKGRFRIEVEGFETLYLPAWTEVSRVIEDCR